MKHTTKILVMLYDEVDRLKAINADLLEALELLLGPYDEAWLGDDGDKADPDGSLNACRGPYCSDIRKARKAILKANE